MQREEAVERVRKLLNLTRSPNAHEADRARERARALMAKHGISEDEVAEESLEVVDDSNHLRDELARIVAASRGCSAVRDGRRLAFRGPKSRVAESARTYARLAGECERRASELPPGTIRDALEPWRICFWLGFVAVLGERLQRVKCSQAVVLVEKDRPLPKATAIASEALRALERYGDEVRYGGEDGREAIEWLRTTAYAAGRALGERVDLGEAEGRGGQIRGLL